MRANEPLSFNLPTAIFFFYSCTVFILLTEQNFQLVRFLTGFRSFSFILSLSGMDGSIFNFSNKAKYLKVDMFTIMRSNIAEVYQ